METFSALLAICAGIHRSPVNSPYKSQWRGALIFSLICAWINGWVNSREPVDLRRHCAHYDVIIMYLNGCKRHHYKSNHVFACNRHSCQGTCQISKRCRNLNYHTHDLNTLRDLTIWSVIASQIIGNSTWVFKLITEKASKLHLTGLLWGDSADDRSPMVRKSFPRHDIIM